MQYFKPGSLVILTWNPVNFQLIGTTVKICSDPYYVGDMVPLKYFKEKYPNWVPYTHLLFQDITDGAGIVSYPVNWMQLRQGFELDYPLVNKKFPLTK